MKKILLIAAMAGLFVASCGREDINPVAYDCFYINTPTLNSTSKLTFNNEGLWWTGGDKIYINGIEHEILQDAAGTWKTKGSAVPQLNGKFYVGIPKAGWHVGDTCLYGPYNFSNGDVIPLAIASSTNRLTLWPCCAVIRTAQYEQMEVEVLNGSGRIAQKGYIQPGENLAQCKIAIGADGEEFGGGEWPPIVGDDAYYYVLPLMEDQVQVKLFFNWEDVQTNPIVLRKGYFYDLN